MKTLIVSATHLELKPLLEKAEKINRIDDKLSSYHLDGNEFDLLCTGVGMVATSFHMGRVLSSHKYDRVINAGIAGSFEKNIPLGTVVEIVEDQFPEMGAEDGEHFLSLLDLELIEADDFPYQSGVLSNEQEIWDLTYPKVKSITVNTAHGSEERIAKTEQRLRPQVESMEGAAFFYACKTDKIPCVQIRAISNYVERRDKASWDIPRAIQRLNTEILKLI
ncbi:MAG: futalosine hydrolase [Flavobacteriales bacterium]|nr:futalosine hydrolase [Flavobacteriales bacterium]